MRLDALPFNFFMVLLYSTEELKVLTYFRCQVKVYSEFNYKTETFYNVKQNLLFALYELIYYFIIIYECLIIILNSHTIMYINITII